METCSKNEAACALDCLKGVHTPHVQCIACMACKWVARRAEKYIADEGCEDAKDDIDALCVRAFGEGLEALACSEGFNSYCPTLVEWIEKEYYSPRRVCKLLKLC